MNNVRVCMISYLFPPLYGGAGMQALRLAQALTRRDICVTVLTARHHADLPVCEILEGVTIRRLPALGGPGLRPASFFISAALYLLRHRNLYNIIHLHGAYRSVIPLVTVARLAGQRTVVKMSQMGTDDPLTSRQRRFGGMLLKALAHTDAVVAITNELAESYSQAGLSPSRLICIPNGVDTTTFHPTNPAVRRKLRETLGLKLDAPVALFVGFVHPRKGVDRLLNIWPKVQECCPSATLLLVGPSRGLSDSVPVDFVQRLDRFAETYNVRPTGQRSKVHLFYQAADVFVLPSRREGLPNALLEAMACGLPSISSSLNGISEVIEPNTNGLLVPLDDDNALAESILHVLNNLGEAEKLGQAARRCILEHYSLDAVATRYVKLYTSLVKQGGIETVQRSNTFR
jgi:glycosyltransferase involved in cell wall biosynthesis